MKPAKSVPADQEREILKVIWQLGPSSVRDVHQKMLKHRKIAYTTVLTMMEILEPKDHLNKPPGERAYLYRTANPRAEVTAGMVRDSIKPNRSIQKRPRWRKGSGKWGRTNLTR
jgi:BlaI family penicillinase repressor